MNIEDDRRYYSETQTMRAAIMQNAKVEAEKFTNDPELLKEQDPEKSIRTKANQIAKNAFIQYKNDLYIKFSDPMYEIFISGSLHSEKGYFYIDLPSELKRMMRSKFAELTNPPKSDLQVSSNEKLSSSSELESPKTSSKDQTSSSSEPEESPKTLSKPESKDPTKKGDSPPSEWIKI